MTFLSTASSCGSSIVGCYAPDGDHCEKPIENAFKINAGMVSLFEESKEKGKEGEISVKTRGD